MERSLFVGDYLYVSKVAYGPQMPNTPLSFPFVHHTMPFSQTKKSFSEAIKWPYHRLKGLKPIRRNDVVVFNFPAGDTVLLEDPAVTYYDVRCANSSVRSARRRDASGSIRSTRSSAAPWTSARTTSNAASRIPGDSLEIRDGTRLHQRRTAGTGIRVCNTVTSCKPRRPSRSTPSTTSASGSTPATARATT